MNATNAKLNGRLEVIANQKAEIASVEALIKAGDKSYEEYLSFLKTGLARMEAKFQSKLSESEIG